MSDITSGWDSYLDRCLDEHQALGDAADRVHESGDWKPQDFDDIVMLVEAIDAYLPGDMTLWDALNNLRGDCKYGTVVALLDTAADKAITDRCYDIAGDP